jgi:hypothetical protein
MDTSALAAQLIGEEPRFDVVLQTAISDRQNYCIPYTTRTSSGQMFFGLEKLFDSDLNINQSIRIR